MVTFFSVHKHKNGRESINFGGGTIEITHSENSLKKKINRDPRIWDIIKKDVMFMSSASQWAGLKKKKVFEEVMAKNIPKLAKGSNPQFQRYRTSQHHLSTGSN